MFNFNKIFSAVVNNAEVGVANSEAKAWEVAGDACCLAMDGCVTVAQTAMKGASKAAYAAEACYKKQEAALKWAADVKSKKEKKEVKAKKRAPRKAKGVRRVKCGEVLSKKDFDEMMESGDSIIVE